MNKTLWRLLRTLHAWGGITLALLLILSGLSGALLVWKQDYLRLVSAAHLADFEPSPETLAPIAEAAEAHFPNNEILLIQFATEQLPLTRVTLLDSHYAYLDPSGQVVDQWQGNERWEEWLYDLHHRLLLGNFGLTLLGLSAIALILLVLTGLVVFWPLRRGFRQGPWPRKLNRPRLLTAHRNLGVWLVVPLLLSLVTAVVLAFPQQAEQLLLDSLRDAEGYSESFDDHMDGISGGNSGDWLPALKRAQASFPDAQIRSAQVPNALSYYRIIGMQQPGQWHPEGLSKVYIEAEGGYMDVRIDASRLPALERAYNAVYPLHTGRLDQLWYKLLLSLAGVLAALLGCMGILAFVQRWTRQGRLNQT